MEKRVNKLRIQYGSKNRIGPLPGHSGNKAKVCATPQKKRRQTIYKIFQKIFPEVTSEFNPSIIINDDETFLSTTFNPDILLTAEHYLNVKVIIIIIKIFILHYFRMTRE